MSSEPARKKPGLKLSYLSLGCDKNLVDTEKILARFKARGYQPAGEAKRSDVFLINTCAFIDAAKQESIEQIIAAVERKKAGAIKAIIVTGCLVELCKQELAREIPEVDFWLKFSELENMQDQAPGFSRIITTPSHLSYLKISEGCDKGCRFCVIPKIRGKFRSLPEKELLREAKFLAQSGVKELNLVAQDLCEYGKDTGSSLVRLLEKLLSGTKIPWFRLFYLNPQGLSRELIKLVASEQRICNYVDFPFQHISDRMLKAMGRPEREKMIKSLIEQLRSSIPGVSIRGTALVGFPGESEDDFEKLAGFIEDSDFDWLGVFAYSAQPGTRGFSLADPVPAETAQKRKEDLDSLFLNLAEEKNRGKIGRVFEVLVDGRSDLGFDYQGRSRAQAYEIDGVTHLKGRYRRGNFYQVRIVDSWGIDLIGEKIKEG